MPTYDYKCDACDHTFEEFQSMSAKPLKKCPECGKNKLVRLIGTGAGVIFKGSGFYETDYRSEGYKKAQEAEKDSGKSKSEGKDKSESKDSKSGDSGKSSGDAGKSDTKSNKSSDKPAKKSDG